MSSSKVVLSSVHIRTSKQHEARIVQIISSIFGPVIKLQGCYIWGNFGTKGMDCLCAPMNDQSGFRFNLRFNDLITEEVIINRMTHELKATGLGEVNFRKEEINERK